jgi:hypothetical protein
MPPLIGDQENNNWGRRDKGKEKINEDKEDIQRPSIIHQMQQLAYPSSLPFYHGYNKILKDSVVL